MPGSEIYVALEKEIARVSGVSWVDEAGWNERFSWTPDSEKRKAEFSLLRRILRLKLKPNYARGPSGIRTVLRIPLHPSDLSLRKPGEQAALLRGYDGVRTRIKKSLLEHKENGVDWIRKNVQFVASNVALVPDSYASPKSFAACLFRSRMEREPALMTFDQPLSMRALWPHIGSFASQFAFNEARWHRFFWTCYQAELRFSSLMRQRTMGLTCRDSRWAEVIRMHASGLIPQALFLPPGVGLLQVGDGQAAHAILVCVAMPSALDSAGLPSIELSNNEQDVKP
jgi:hypothetical protein